MQWRDGLIGGLATLALAAAADPAGWRFSAPIQVQQDAPLVQLPLTPSAYGRSQLSGLADLRIVDARGERVPFAFLAPRDAEITTTEQTREAAMYALPQRPAANGEWSVPLEIIVQGERITIKRGGATTAAQAMLGAAAHSGGWVFDLGRRTSADPPTQSLRLTWSAPAEFSAGFDLQTSDDLRQWRGAGSGQLLALASPTGPLTQPTVLLPANVARFVRLVWLEPTSAPTLTRAEALAQRPLATPLDAPTELVLAPTLAPAPGLRTVATDEPKHALHFDLGAVLPVVQLDLQLGTGTRVAPVRLQGRSRADAPWRELAPAVFYRFERGGAVSVSPPLALRTELRFLRVVPDERSAALDPAQTHLAVQAQLTRLVFARQGEAPFTLWAGAAQPGPGALPLATLVPQLDEERPRFGRATLGAWSEVAAVARQAETAEQLAALRPWLLWAVLLVGVAALALMVWRLMRAPAAGA